MTTGPVDLSELWLQFFFWYAGMFLLWAVSTAVLAAGALFLNRRYRSGRGLPIVSILLTLSVLGWVSYFVMTAKWTFTKLALDGEDDTVAEWAYYTHFKTDSLDRCMELAMNHGESENVRFYAACRMADILSSRDDKFVNSFLDDLDSWIWIHPLFFGTNGINGQFFVTGTIAGPYNVKKLVLQRLEHDRLGNTGKAATSPH